MRFIFVLLFAVWASWAAAFDASLASPPSLSQNDVALAENEMLPENVLRTHTVYASDNPDDSKGVYAEVLVATRAGRKSADGYTSGTLYVEIPLSESDVSLWGTAYYDPSFRGVYTGLAKKFDNLQVALGVGSAWYDGARYNVINPWIFYSSDEYESLFMAEHYIHDTEKPWYYKGYLQRKVGADWLLGIYGEKDFGVGPMATWNVSKGVRLWGAIPLAYTPNEEKMKLIFGIKLVFE